MYKYIKNKYIDYKLWDECVEKAPNGNIYTLTWYLDIVSPGWDAIIKEHQGKYVSIFPVTHARKFGIKYLRQPYFCNQLGIFHCTSISEQDLIEVLDLVRTKFNYVINYPLNLENSLFVKNKVGDYEFADNISYEVNMSQPYDNIFSRFSKDRKNNIERALSHNLNVSVSEDLDQLIKIFKENTASKIYGGVLENQYNILRKLFAKARERGMSEIYSVNSANQIIAATLVFKYKNRIIKFFNSSTPEGRQKNGDSLIMNMLLRTYSNQKVIFDFERGSLESINKYKESYGADKRSYYSISLNRLPNLLKTLKRIRQYILIRNK